MKYYVLTDSMPCRDEPPFPCCPATQTLSRVAISCIFSFCAEKGDSLNVQLGESAYKSLGPAKPEFTSFDVVSSPTRSDFIAGEWIERRPFDPEWEDAQYEDAIFWEGSNAIAIARCRRSTGKLPARSCLTHRELLEEIHAMLKQLLREQHTITAN